MAEFTLGDSRRQRRDACARVDEYVVYEQLIIIVGQIDRQADIVLRELS